MFKNDSFIVENNFSILIGPGKPKTFDEEDIILIEPKWILAPSKDFRNELRSRLSLKKKIKVSELDTRLISTH